MDVFVQHGTFLVIERWRKIVFRQLVKRVWLVQGKESRLAVDAVRTALVFTGVDMDEAEVECILANLIGHGLIKGYISHEKRMV